VGLGVLACFLLFWTYRVLAARDARSFECHPVPANPAVRWDTRDEGGRKVTFPARIDFPVQQRPLVVMTYNIAGHDELFRSDHIARIAAAINQVRPDIVGLQEVHRRTWQSRYHDQLEALERGTGMHGFFGRSIQKGKGEFGNAILTRGDIVSVVVHPLPGGGEPRILIESVLRIDGATINFYVTHLATWDRLNASVRRKQIDCVSRYIRASSYPFLLTGDFNAGPDSPEVRAFDQECGAQLCGRVLPNTNPMLRRRIDYVWADYGWEVRGTQVRKIGPSDHWPVVAELMWNR
jgi:endonuclease/exonuclease/phosphatase family metal-dependent hydrolase